MQISRISKALEKAKKERVMVKTKKEPVGSSKVFNRLKETSTFKNLVDQMTCSIDASLMDKRIVVHHDPDSYLTEQYRMMRTNMNSLGSANAYKVILMSSSIEGEGKTLTSINYSHTLASDPTKKVLLVDCDLRKGTLGNYFKHQAEQGITDYLDGNAAFEDVVTKSATDNLHIIFRGGKMDNPVEALDSKRMKDFLKKARGIYDYIILDAPPILPITDAAVLGAEADGILLVVRMGSTRKDAVRHAVDLFKQAKTKILGIVITNVDYARSYGYKKYYYYSYN